MRHECSGLMLLCACKPIASTYRFATAQAQRNVQNQYLPTDRKLCSGAAWLNLAVALLMQQLATTVHCLAASWRCRELSAMYCLLPCLQCVGRP